MDILYLVGGATFGAILAGVVGASIPGLETQYRIAITLVGCFLGLALGYWMMWIAKQDQLQHEEHRKKRIQAQNPRPRQVVGHKCAQCQSSIIFVADGHICPYCQQVKCKNCEPTIPCQDCGKAPFVAEVVEEPY